MAGIRKEGSMKVAHCYSWQEQAIHGVDMYGRPDLIRGAKAFCGHTADPKHALKSSKDDPRCAACSKKVKSKK
jgi:hypothetical protein